MNTAQALREVLGVVRNGIEHTCPRCYSQKVQEDVGNAKWRCTNCPWSGPEADTIGGNQTAAPPMTQQPQRNLAFMKVAPDLRKAIANKQHFGVVYTFVASSGPKQGSQTIADLEFIPPNSKQGQSTWMARAIVIPTTIPQVNQAFGSFYIGSWKPFLNDGEVEVAVTLASMHLDQFYGNDLHIRIL
jgi:ribosomal protein L37AE/L43A